MFLRRPWWPFDVDPLNLAWSSGGLVCRDKQTPYLRMARGRFWVGYPWVSGLAGLGSGMISHPRFLGSGHRNLSGSDSGLVFHPWISNGYPK